MKYCLFALLAVLGASVPALAKESERPNFLLIVFEDMSPHMRAYGDGQAQTPVLNSFAEQSVLYERAFTTAGVCAPSRAALAMGMYQQSLGAQQMRTLQGATLSDGTRLPYTAVPPPEVKAYPELLRAAGYYTTNNGKTDYQLELSYLGGPFTIWDETAAEHPWRGRAEGQPFFAMVNIMETHESWTFPADIDDNASPWVPRLMEPIRAALATRAPVHDPATLTLPPYLPDTPLVRAEYAQMLDNIFYYEKTVADLLERLEEDGLAENTIVIVTSDHGDGVPRAKRSLYDSGLHVPLMVRWPDGHGAGTRIGELISFVDIAPTVLDLAGVDVPEWMVGRVFLGDNTGPERAFVYAAMDRHDEVPDFMRAVRDHRWKYIRNYEPDHPFFRHLAFRDLQRSMQEMWRLEALGELPPQIAQYFTVTRPAEELYDTWSDPFELNNLVGDPDYSATLEEMRGALARFDSKTEDRSVSGELAMVERMWPGLTRPETLAPVAHREGGRVTLHATTEGASIGYRIDEGAWELYTKPVRLRSGHTLEAKAIRYGFTVSPVIRIEG